MPLPDLLAGRLRIPAIAAPMFLASGPDLVVEVCRSGLIGAFPALNQRTSSGLDDWLGEITGRLADLPDAAPFAVNLIVHRSNPRLAEDLELVVAHQVPIVITSLGAVKEVVSVVHSYGGLVFHDVTTRRHAEKAASAGVDGIIAVCAGAGGHAGILNPFALVAEIASFFPGAIVLSGSMSTGRDVAAARMLGVDLAYLGTRFIATRESMADQLYKEMVVSSTSAEIVYTSRLSGVHANFLRPSITAAGLDPDRLPEHDGLFQSSEAKVWKNFWSAGHGVAAIDDILPAAQLCEQMIADYRHAMRGAARDAFLRPSSAQHPY